MIEHDCPIPLPWEQSQVWQCQACGFAWRYRVATGWRKLRGPLRTVSSRWVQRRYKRQRRKLEHLLFIQNNVAWFQVMRENKEQGVWK